jgi:hypothetical protein
VCSEQTPCSLNVFTQSQSLTHCVAHLPSETVLRFLSPPERLSKSGRTQTVLDSSPVLFNKDVPSILIGGVGPVTHLRAAAGSLRLNHNSSTMQSQDAKYIYCVDSGPGNPKPFAFEWPTTMRRSSLGSRTSAGSTTSCAETSAALRSCEPVPTGSVAIPSMWVFYPAPAGIVSLVE